MTVLAGVVHPIKVSPSTARVPHRRKFERIAPFRLALVCMPFVSMYRPSLQLGLLKGLAERCGVQTSTFHLNLDFARQIGPELYEHLVHHRGRLFGDWLFSLAAFGDDAPDPDSQLLDQFPEEADLLLSDLQHSKERLRSLREIDVPSYLDRMVESISWNDYRVVGFTSTFQQSIAAFALASRLKAQFPGLLTIFGGANLEGEMGEEVVRVMDCVDFAVIGEGDEVFPEFLTALADGLDPSNVPGIVTRRNMASAKTEDVRIPFDDLNSLPVPDFQEFFDRAAALDLIPDTPRRPVFIPFESARGCWWGQKHHCTFCGLNGSTMRFRAKSPDRVILELAQLARSYRSFMFEAVDNIADAGYFKSLFPRIAADGYDYEFFYEVKSNLTRDKLKLLREAGVRKIQPGIESLSSHVLSLMRKGVSGIQNVNMLRWALYYGIDVGWNILWGFPGETAEDYERQVATIKWLTHLEPPTGAGRIWMERFSPIFTDRASFPARYVRPEASYAYVYPRYVRLDRVAYFFDYSLENALPDSAFDSTRAAVRDWRDLWKAPKRPTLKFWSSPNFLQIDDLRDPTRYGTYTFTDQLAALYQACSDRPRASTTLRQELSLSESPEDIESALDEFCAQGLMIREGSSYLSLALPANGGR